jgi:hypothetical protein
MVPVQITAYDQTGKTVHLLSWIIKGQAGGTAGGGMCCVSIPKYWRPGLILDLYWDYTAQSEGSPPPQRAKVEIEEYSLENLGTLHLHFFPGHRVRAIVARTSFDSPFYPMQKEEWVNWKIDQDHLNNWKEGYYEMIKGGTVPTEEDWKWAAQWGLYKEYAMSEEKKEEVRRIDEEKKRKKARN